jgi:hypothetical protein
MSNRPLDRHKAPAKALKTRNTHYAIQQRDSQATAKVTPALHTPTLASCLGSPLSIAPRHSCPSVPFESAYASMHCFTAGPDPPLVSPVVISRNLSFRFLDFVWLLASALRWGAQPSVPHLRLDTLASDSPVSGRCMWALSFLSPVSLSPSEGNISPIFL